MYRIAETGKGTYVIIKGTVGFFFGYDYVMNIESGTTVSYIEHAVSFRTEDSARENLNLLKEYEEKERIRQEKKANDNSIVRIIE